MENKHILKNIFDHLVFNSKLDPRVKFLGRGAFGSTFEADGIVMKFIRLHSDPSAISRQYAKIESEVGILEELSDIPELEGFLSKLLAVKFIEFEGSTTKFACIFQDYIPSVTLHDYINAVLSGKIPPISPTKAYKFFLELKRGLKALHTAGYLHRDLKPDNILVRWVTGAKQDEIYYRPIFIDFGLACKFPCEDSIFRGTAKYTIPNWSHRPRNYSSVLNIRGKLVRANRYSRHKQSKPVFSPFYDEYSTHLVLHWIGQITDWKKPMRPEIGKTTDEAFEEIYKYKVDTVRRAFAEVAASVGRDITPEKAVEILEERQEKKRRAFMKVLGLEDYLSVARNAAKQGAEGSRNEGIAKVEAARAVRNKKMLENIWRKPNVTRVAEPARRNTTQRHRRTFLNRLLCRGANCLEPER